MKKALLAVMLLGCATTASAESLIYAGADVGSSDLGGDSSTSYGVHVGTALTLIPFMSVEAGYQDFGKFDSSNYDNTTGELKANTKYIAIRPNVELGPLQVYAKAGLHDYEIESTSGSYNQSEVDGFYGLGAKYSIMGPLTIGASYNNYNFKNDDMKSFNVSIDFHFL